MSKRVYCAIGIRHVQLDRVVAGREGLGGSAGVDVGKRELCIVLRWSDGRFEKPWSVANPTQIPQLVQALSTLGQGREMQVAMEPTGTYGDALRQALSDAGIALQHQWTTGPVRPARPLLPDSTGGTCFEMVQRCARRMDHPGRRGRDCDAPDGSSADLDHRGRAGADRNRHHRLCKSQSDTQQSVGRAAGLGKL